MDDKNKCFIRIKKGMGKSFFCESYPTGRLNGFFQSKCDLKPEWGNFLKGQLIIRMGKVIFSFFRGIANGNAPAF